MKRKIKVGIPRSLIYYRDGIFLKYFLTNLNCKIELGPEITLNYSKKECIPYISYLNNIDYLKEKCDYIIIPNIRDYGKNKRVCHCFNINKEIITNKITNRQILNYTICHTKFKYRFTSVIKIGLKLSKNIIKIIYSYIKAIKKEKDYILNKENYQKHLIEKPQPKVLILSPFYILEDPLINNKITTIFKNNNIIPIFSSRLNKKTAYMFSKYYKEEIGNLYIKEMIGAYYYYQHIISKVIYISSYNCKIDSLLRNTSILKKDISLINIYLEEGIENKIQSQVKKIN